MTTHAGATLGKSPAHAITVWERQVVGDLIAKAAKSVSAKAGNT
jgi:hypothetical protein